MHKPSSQEGKARLQKWGGPEQLWSQPVRAALPPCPPGPPRPLRPRPPGDTASLESLRSLAAHLRPPLAAMAAAVAAAAAVAVAGPAVAVLPPSVTAGPSSAAAAFSAVESKLRSGSASRGRKGKEGVADIETGKHAPACASDLGFYKRSQIYPGRC